MRNKKEKILSVLMLIALVTNNLLYPINYVVADDSPDVEINSVVDSLSGESSVESDTGESESDEGGGKDSGDNISDVEEIEDVESVDEIVENIEKTDNTDEINKINETNEIVEDVEEVENVEDVESTEDIKEIENNDEINGTEEGTETEIIVEKFEEAKNNDEIENIEETELDIARKTLNVEPIEKIEKNNGVTVKVYAAENTFPEGTKAVIEAITRKSDLDKVKDQLGDSVEDDAEVVAFDIRFEYELSDGTKMEVQPLENTVQVTFDYSKNRKFKQADKSEEQQIDVYHINDKDENGEKVEQGQEVVEKIEINHTASEEINNAVVIDAETFSIYVLSLSEDNDIVITLNPGDGTIIDREDIVVNENGTGTITSTEGIVILPGATRTGSIFSGWYTISGVYAGISGDSCTISQSIQLTAIRECDTINNFVLSGGVCVCDEGHILEGNSCVLQPVAYTILDQNPDFTWGTIIIPRPSPVSVGPELYIIMDRNLGAITGGTSVDAYGYYYQWGNNYGFATTGDISKVLKSEVNIDLSLYGPASIGMTPYYSGVYVRTPSGQSNRSEWAKTGNNNIWGDTSDTLEARQGPCPTGWHIPSKNERNQVITYWKGLDQTIDLKLPPAGNRGKSSGDVWSNAGTQIQIWTSTPINNGKAYILSGYAIANDKDRSDGLPIRCFKNTYSCDTGFHLEGNTCVSNIKTGFCYQREGLEHGHYTGINDEITITWSGSNWEPVCDVECDEGYSAKDNLCISDEGFVTVTFKLNGGIWYDGFTGDRVVTIESGTDVDGIRPTKDPYRMGDGIYSGYMFLGWFQDVDSNDRFHFQGTTLISDTILIAKWAPYNDIQYCASGNCVTFMDRHLGATSNDISSPNSYGYYYQWGNNYGFTASEVNNYSTNPVSTIGYGPGNRYYGETFIKVGDKNWSSTQNENLWGGGGDTVGENSPYYDSMNARWQRQGPCPKGYHVPSANELHLTMTIFMDKYGVSSSITDNWPTYVGLENDANFTLTSLYSNFKNDFKIPLAGRIKGSATLEFYGQRGQYWSSTPFIGANSAVGVQDKQGIYNMGGWKDQRSYAKSVRCYKDGGDYTVRWKNYDNSELEVDYYVYSGATPTYDQGVNPTKVGGYEFTGWYVEGDETQTIVDLSQQTIRGNTTYVAKFQQTGHEETYHVVVDIDPVGGGVVQGESRYDSGDEIILTGVANEGFEFLGWFTGNTLISTANPYVFIADDSEGTGFTAVFSPLYSIHTGSNNESRGIISYTVMNITRQGKQIRFMATPYSLFELDKRELNGDDVTTGGNTYLDVILSGNVSLTGYFVEPHVPTYTVIFVDEDGITVLGSGEYEYGTASGSIVLPAEPTKTGDAQYTYTFAGWMPTIGNVTGDATYTATFDRTTNEYTITWKDGNGSILKTEQVAYGEIPAYVGDTPAKAEDDQYIYTFNNTWSPEVGSVTGPATYTAQFNTTLKNYTVTLTVTPAGYGILNPGSIFADYGTPISINGATVTIGTTGYTATASGADAQYTYAFSGWINNCGDVVIGVCTITAEFIRTVNNYTVTFYDEDETTVLDSQTLPYGSTPTYGGAAPTKSQDAQYTYTFGGWSPAIQTVEGNQTYTATYTPTLRSYTITWLDDDDSVIDTTTVNYGVVPTHADLTKAADAQYTYTFDGWTPTVVSVTGPATYKATYSTTTNEYTITWNYRDANGGRVEYTGDVAYGQTPSAPTLPATSQSQSTVYTFTSWDPAVASITGPATYTAQYSQSPRPYTITWKNDDGITIDTITVNYGIVPTHASGTKAADAQYTYTFAGWSPTPTAVTGDATYTATFNSTVNEYTITWKDGNGAILKTEQVAYGEIPAYVGDTPTKDADNTYTYTFNNTWSPTIVSVTEDATYIAQFTPNYIDYTVTWKDYDGRELSGATYHYNDDLVVLADPTRAPDETYTYTFNSWTPAPSEKVTESKVYTATYDEDYIDYTITFVNEGVEISSEIYHYGDIVNEPADPNKSEDAQYTYMFAGWSPAVHTVTGSQIYTAQYTPNLRSYTVTVVSNNTNSGTVTTGSFTVPYGTIISTSSNVLTVGTGTSTANSTPSNDQYTYTFVNWTDDCGGNTVTKACTITANFTSVVNDHTVTIVSNDENSGTVSPISVTVPYGTVITPNEDDLIIGSYTITATPTTNDAQYTYTFDGWTTNCGGNVVTGCVITGNFSSTVNEYLITWSYRDEDGVPTTSTGIWDYGQTPMAPTLPATSQSQSTVYTFTSWSSAVAPVAGPATYTAQYSESPRSYEIIWLNDDDSVIDTTTVDYDVVPTHADATKAATDEWTYTFAGWTPTPAAVTGDATYKATFTAEKNSYTITLTVDPNGWGALNPGSVYAEYGTLISTNGNIVTIGTGTYTANPTIADAQYTYTFSGWINNCGDVVIGVCTITAEFIRTVNSYTVIVVSNNTNSGTVTTGSFIVPYGTAISTSSNVLTVGTGTSTANSTPSNDQYTYTFVNWTDDCGGNTVTKACTIIANFESTVNDHTVNIASNDTNSGTVSESSVTVPYGTAISTNENVLTIGGNTITATPTTNDAQYTYTFVRWNNTCGDEVVIGCNITAEFTSVVNNYTVTIVSSDIHSGTVTTGSITVPYGISINTGSNVVTIGTETSTANPNEQTQQWNFSFANWTNACGVEVIDNCTITANFNSTLRSYTIQFVSNNNEYGTVSSNSMTTNYGAPINVDDANRTVTVYGTITANPTPSDDQYTYTFLNWINSCGNELTDNCTITGNFTRTTNEYTITWKDGNGSILKTEQVAYGEIPAYVGDTPTKDADNTYTYTFNNTWSPAIVSVTEDATYIAQFTPNYIDYTVTWKDYDGTELSGATYHYNDDLVVLVDPTRAPDNTYTYTFNSWTPAPSENVTESKVYTATYDEHYIDYTITFVNWDNQIISSNTYHYGDTVIEPVNPTRPADEQYIYTFAGWSPSVTAVLGDKTYMAQYDSTVNGYEITWNYRDTNGARVEFTSNELYGSNPALPTLPELSQTQSTVYTFVGWDSEIVVVEGVKTYTAQYNEAPRQYTIIWKNDDGTIIDTTIVNYGVVPTHADPSKAAITQYIYTFVGWNPELVAVTGNAEYTAVFQETSIKTNGGESGIRKDNCPNGDFSDSYYDGICGKENTHGSAGEKDELRDAYERAYSNGITTMDTLDKADPDGYLLRGHMAKMAVNFMVNSLGYDMPDDIPEHCLSFNDDPSIWESDEIKYYAERACALGIMGIDMINNKFLPNDIVSRAEFGTIASRIIWGSRYNVRNTAQHPYYERHLNELKREKIMTKVENPLSWDELRKWVWLVFKRISEKK